MLARGVDARHVLVRGGDSQGTPTALRSRPDTSRGIRRQSWRGHMRAHDSRRRRVRGGIDGAHSCAITTPFVRRQLCSGCQGAVEHRSCRPVLQSIGARRPARPPSRARAVESAHAVAVTRAALKFAVPRLPQRTAAHLQHGLFQSCQLVCHIPETRAVGRVGIPAATSERSCACTTTGTQAVVCQRPCSKQGRQPCT